MMGCAGCVFRCVGFMVSNGDRCCVCSGVWGSWWLMMIGAVLSGVWGSLCLMVIGAVCVQVCGVHGV